MANILGWKIERKAKPSSTVDNFAPPTSDDGAAELIDTSVKTTLFDLGSTADSSAQLVSRYRELSMQPEVENAIEDIVNEMIVETDSGDDPIVEINLANLPKAYEGVKSVLENEFNIVSRLYDFQQHAYQICRRWYIDGRLPFYCAIDKKHPELGIQEMRYIDPRTLKKVRKIVTKPDQKQTGTNLIKDTEEYFIYRPRGVYETTMTYSVPQGSTKIAADSMVYVTSGLMDSNNKMPLSYLHKALKPLNQLRSLEDASIINKLVRAPMRRIFEVEIGSLSKAKGEQYLKDQMTNYKNKMTYNSSSGQATDARHFMTMLEDFWFPTRQGNPVVKVTNLPGADTWHDLSDLEYFRDNLYKALNIPVSRLQPDSPFNLGRPSEITRDEVKFARFISRMRVRFSDIFVQAMIKQMVLKGIADFETARDIMSYVKFDYQHDNFFSELKSAEIETSRMQLLDAMTPHVGKYYSMDWVRRNVLQQTEEEIAEQMALMQKEREMGLYDQPSAQDELGVTLAGAQAQSSVQGQIAGQMSMGMPPPGQEQPNDKKGSSGAKSDK